MAKITLQSRDATKPFAIIDDDLLDELSTIKWTWSKGYASGRIMGTDGKSRQIQMHRYIMGAQAGEIVDHKNRNRLDNRRRNLRLVTGQQNSWNRSKSSADYVTSRFVGVSRYKRVEPVRWKVSIWPYEIGIFDDEEEAAYMRDQFAMQLYGEYANLNFDYEGSITVLAGLRAS